MESINRDTAFTPIFAPFSIGFAYWRIEDYARLRLCMYIYISKDIILFSSSSWNIRIYCQWNFLIFNINCFEFSSGDQSRRSRFKYIYIYIGNFFENYAIQVFNSPGVTKRGIWSESMIDPCLSCSLYVIIKLSIFDISSSSDKFNDTRWIKVHGSVLDGASSFLLASNVSIFKLIGVRVTLRRFNETNSLIAVWCNIRSLTLISEFLRSCRIFRGGYVVVKSVTCLLSVP